MRNPLKSGEHVATRWEYCQFPRLTLLSLFLLIFLSANSQQLPFSIKSKEWKQYKLTDSHFNSGGYSDAVKAYSKCEKIIRFFPQEYYKYALALWVTKDTIKAREVFKKALDCGLKFDDPQTLELSPLLKELSGTEEVYKQLRKTLYYDDVAEETAEYKLLMELKEIDQHFRMQTPVDVLALNRADSVNRELFKPLLLIWNWPGIFEVGYQGEGAAFLIAQHSDNDLKFQKECLKRMEREFYKGNITISSYAMLIDRYLVNTNNTQIFGTQVIFDEVSGSFEPKPLMYPDEVESLRNLFGLGKLKPYLEKMNQKYRAR